MGLLTAVLPIFYQCPFLLLIYTFKGPDKKYLKSFQNRKKYNSTAEQLFFDENPKYKNQDYRCIDPNSHSDPRQWGSFDMQEYRAAESKEEMKKVSIMRYNKNFNNWKDPQVFNAFVTDPRKLWQQTYGLPYASPVPKTRIIKRFSKRDPMIKWTSIENIDSSRCHLRCLHMVGSSIQGCFKSVLRGKGS